MTFILGIEYLNWFKKSWVVKYAKIVCFFNRKIFLNITNKNLFISVFKYKHLVFIYI